MSKDNSFYNCYRLNQKELTEYVKIFESIHQTMKEKEEKKENDKEKIENNENEDEKVSNQIVNSKNEI